MKKKSKVDFKILIAGIIIIAVIFLIVFFGYKQLTGRAIANIGDDCERNNEKACGNDKNVILCANNKWIDGGKIPGQCGYQETANSPVLPPDSTGQKKGSLTLVIIACLVLLILVAGGIVIYLLMKKKNPKPASQQAGNFPTSRFGLNQRVMAPLQKQRSFNSKLPSDIKRFTPPKR